jgi:hypothetical protein
VPPLPFGPVPGGRRPNTQAVLEGGNDARTGMPPGIPGGAMCVQRLDDSLICNSHYLSHFAAFFIDAGTKRSVVESFNKFSLSLRLQSSYSVHRCLRRARARGRKPPGGLAAGPPKQQGTINTGGRLDPEGPHSVMILPQVHLRKPCYDFYFL